MAPERPVGVQPRGCPPRPSAGSSRRYREHDEVASAQVGTLQRELAEEWVRLNADPSLVLVLERWSTGRPELTGARRPADLVDSIDAGCPAAKDELLGALIDLFQQGQQLAGRVLLQAMLPKLSSFAFRSGLLARIEARPEDRFQFVLCEFWEVLSAFPIERRRSRIAANLVMETLHRLARVTRLPEVAMDPVQLGELTELPDVDTPERRLEIADPEPDPGGDLDALLAWAQRNKVLPGADVALLRTVYLLDAEATQSSVSAAYRRAAAECGTSGDAMRQRTHRARRRLSAAVREARSASGPLGERIEGAT